MTRAPGKGIEMSGVQQALRLVAITAVSPLDPCQLSELEGALLRYALRNGKKILQSVSLQEWRWGNIKKNKRTNRLAAWSFPCFFQSKLLHLQLPFFCLFVCLFGGRGGLGFPGTTFSFSSFLKGCNCWEGPPLPRPRGHGGTSTVVVVLVCNKLLLFSPLNWNLSVLFLTHDR